MELALEIVGWVLFGIAVVAGLLLDIVGLFGNWIIIGAVTLAFVFSGLEYFSLASIGIMLVLAIIGEIAETAAAGFGAAKFGGSRGSILAAIIGCLLGAIVGTPFMLVIGTIVGAAIGAFAGAALYEYLQGQKSFNDSTRIGVGAALGKVAGLFAKTFAGFAILLVGFIDLFF